MISLHITLFLYFIFIMICFFHIKKLVLKISKEHESFVNTFNEIKDTLDRVKRDVISLDVNQSYDTKRLIDKIENYRNVNVTIKKGGKNND